MASRYATSRPVRSETDSDIGRVPRPPTQCGVYGCATKQGRCGDADVLLMVVDDHGRERGGAASDFANEGEKSHALTMRSGYEFVRWVARCSECYQRDLDRTRKGKWNYVPTGTDCPPQFLSDPCP